MPPKGPKLTDGQVAALAEWVKMGAPWPASSVAVRAEGKQITDEMRSFWSFQPLKMPAIPAPKDDTSAKTDIDRLVLAKLEAKGLKPTAQADRRTLIRLPPSILSAFLPPRKRFKPSSRTRIPRPTRYSSIASSLHPVTGALGAPLARRRPLRR